MKIQTVKSFNKKLTSAIATTENLGDTIQLLALFALEYASKEGNLSPLAKLITDTKPLKQINSKTLEAFCLAHVKNIEWKKEDNTVLVAQKNKDGSKKKILVANKVSGFWFDFETGTKKAKKASQLAKLSSESLNDKLDAFKARVAATKSKDALATQATLLEAQLKAVHAKMDNKKA